MYDKYGSISYRNKDIAKLHVSYRGCYRQTEIDTLFNEFIRDNDLLWADELIDTHLNLYVVAELCQEMYWLKKMVGDLKFSVGDKRQVADQLGKIQSMRQNLERWVPILLNGSKNTVSGRSMVVSGEITSRRTIKDLGKPTKIIRILDHSTGAYYDCREPAPISRTFNKPHVQ